MNPLKSAQLLKQVMFDYYKSMSSPVAWCTSAGPAELLRSFGFSVYFPENHGALLGATRRANDCIPLAVNAGYSGEICSYLTSDIGAYLKRETPLTRAYGLKEVPKPDLIVFNTNQCREVEDWFTFFAGEFDSPIHGIHPPRHLDRIREPEIELVVRQLGDLISTCERVSGTQFDEDRFGEVVSLSKEGTRLWQEVLQTARTHPSPLTFFDGTIHMGPIVLLRGTQECVDYYQVLLSELKERMEKGVGAVEKEQCRIFWDGMPVWGRLRALADLFHDNRAAVIASTYCNSWIFDSFDEKDPMESLALAYTQIFINRSEQAKLSMLKQWISDFDIDGVIFHNAKTCFNNSNTRFGLPKRLEEETGIPGLIVEGDLNDLRFFSDAQNRTKIETFVEQITGQEY
ncbi:MAG: 2-hydroxyacyl-CoA dehydratase family protein [Candidatus Neomarinimicrobiota bacterium]